MNIFKIFNSSDNKGNNFNIMNRVDLDSLFQLDALVSLSQQQPVVIFKHSTKCAVSRMALKRFGEEYDFDTEQLTLYYLDILRYRDISNAIAARFAIKHESPQLLLIKGGKVIYSASHDAIDAETLKKIISV